ncbi:hypothetical protein C4D60_Mb09t23870 [Musa balbisiana]|uniref:Uncharacterized protein n=1 Tax=Musa balbisiana TaxID=52838 RepID=A0A4S8IK02_MUSBA|nr:hypothetical protein C4D60_Mb09t23870 [Musa balbisiana]
MHHISPKAKDDVRKILSSKHLFYREMCAYHNGQKMLNCHDVNLQVCPVPKLAPPSSLMEDEEEDEDEGNDIGDHDEWSYELGKKGFESFRLR